MVKTVQGTTRLTELAPRESSVKCEPETRASETARPKPDSFLHRRKETTLSRAAPAAIERVLLEARAGIEPAHRGFADLGLTTWLPRRTSRAADVAVKISSPQELKLHRCLK